MQPRDPRAFLWDVREAAREPSESGLAACSSLTAKAKEKPCPL
jgi:hypothetical protein